MSAPTDAAAPLLSLSWVGASIDHECLLSHRPRPALFAYSLQGNNIGEEGVTKLAAVLKETKISELKYATTSNRPPSVRFCVSAR